MLLLQAAAPALSHPLAGTVAEYVWLLPILPLFGFLINGALSLAASYHPGPSDPDVGHGEPNAPSGEHGAHGGHGSNEDVHAAPRRPAFASIVTLVGPLVLALSFVLAVAMFLAMPADMSTPFVKRFFSWMPVGTDLQIDWAFQLDQLSMIMALVITGVGTLIHIFSLGYMRDDPGFARFFAYLNLFVAFMLVLVLGASYPVLFVGWEGVGLCSYLLIGFWYEDKANADAGLKAFIVNRIGDFGFLMAMFQVWTNLGALDFVGVHSAASALPVGGPLVTTICLFFFLGCAGKSAQIPLYVWLPDAMAGPTPVSALIHAATMVTAGVYLIARSSFLFAMAPAASLTVAVIGAITALFAATIGLKQWDIKKVLAYSTVSQLGYMFVGVGVGAYVAGMFHLVTHAFFKALLFLGAGSVIFAMHQALHHTHSDQDAQDMRNMGGFRKYMPWTFAMMWIATLAIAGIPIFAGFFSKDEILSSVFARAHDSMLADTTWLGIPGTYVLYGVYLFALIGALLTAIYMTRLMLYTFHGPNRTGEREREHLHEAPWTMTAPIVVLGVLSALGGAINLPALLHLPEGWTGGLEHWLDPVVGEAALRMTHGTAAEIPHGTELTLVAIAIVVAVGGVLFAVARLKPAALVPKAEAPPAHGFDRVLENKYYVDEIYDDTVVEPTVTISRNLLWKGVDQGLIDGLFVNGSAWLARGFAAIGSWMQSGQVGAYAWAIVVGVLAVLGAFTLR
jgi:NADH-quinone oxidoreductase subunit L